MAQLSLLFAILVAGVFTMPLSERIRIPQPVLMTVFGMVLALLPFVPNISVEPDLILPLVLPPLIYAAAQRSSVRYFKANAKVILLLAVALVLVTTGVVAWVFHGIHPALPLGAAVALGALVSPPDPVAAAAVAGQVGMPRRLLGILETEGLFNDVVALVVYGLAIGAVVTGEFSAGAAALELVLSAVVALAVGIGLGWLTGKLMGYLDDSTLQVAISLLVPFAAYVLADEFHGSGVLAVLVASLVIGQRVEADDVGFRLSGAAFWDVVELLVNGIAFGLIGLELASVVSSGIEWRSMLGDASIVLAVVIGVRLLWLLPGAWLANWLDRRRGSKEDAAPLNWRESMVLWWSGMRGVASIALALAVPFSVHGGKDFPGRDRIIVIAFAVVLFTLLVQGLTLPLVVRVLGLTADQDAENAAERRLWLRATKAALRRLKEIDEDEELPEDMVERLRLRHADRLARFRPDVYDEEQRAEAKARVLRIREFRRVEDEMLAASRAEMVDARSEPGADPELVDRVLRSLDLRSNPR
ncbi:Na+/H+ antiporter [Phaeacidiphilus oryzae]|uniref:Na+/H+ antiporter n=1 Tax=Phaeacidiphilus oryzae TaxID=348818 RepID=UPI00055F24E4|nr:Na+/H+ antiporter [Phaeacidiphilus oryzae]